MIVPTVGRMVLFRPDRYFTGAWTEGEPLPAIVCKVWSPSMVNLSVFDANGQQHSVTSVELAQEGCEAPSGRYCEWMPYQKAVASGQIQAALHAESLAEAKLMASAGPPLI